MGLFATINQPRPLYETKADLDRETKAKGLIETQFSCKLHKVPKDYRVDYCMTLRDNEIVGWCEIKCRNNESTRYPTYMVSLKKISEGLRLAEMTNAPFTLFIQFTDKLMYYIVKTTDKLEYKVGGRTVQTRDAQDIEPVVYIPMVLFREVVQNVSAYNSPSQ